MCGRTACTLDPNDICQACSYKDPKGKWQTPMWSDSPNGRQYYASYNIAPTSHTPVLTLKPGNDSCDAKDRIVQPMYWGLVPFWHKGSLREVGLGTNNARFETLLEKRIFSVPLNKGHRCVVLADGYYEWKSDGKTTGTGSKQPYFIYFPQPNDVKVWDHSWKQSGDMWSEDDGWKGPRLLTMAGVYNIWNDPNDGSVVYSYAVITLDASPAVSFIHDRMPAILDDEDAIRDWLDVDNVPLTEAVKLITPSTTLTYHPVSKIVGNSRNKSPECIVPIDLMKKEATSKSSLLMQNWLKKSPIIKTEAKKEKVDEVRPTLDTDIAGTRSVKREMSSPDNIKPVKRERNHQLPTAMFSVVHQNSPLTTGLIT